MEKKLCLGLFSGSLDKLIQAGVILSGAAADDMDVDIFVLTHAARVFNKKYSQEEEMAEFPLLKDEFKGSLEKLNVPSWIEFFEQAKEFTNVKVYICSLAGKIWGGEKREDFIDLVDDFCGIGEYIDSAASADLQILL